MARLKSLAFSRILNTLAIHGSEQRHFSRRLARAIVGVNADLLLRLLAS
jgi:hypothetical protein